MLLEIGYVTEEGNVKVEDRYAMAKETPILDDCQSWKLVAGEETQGVTIIEVRRKLDTKDFQDRPITSGNLRIVWAFGMTDEFSYHEANRFTTG